MPRPPSAGASPRSRLRASRSTRATATGECPVPAHNLIQLGLFDGRTVLVAARWLVPWLDRRVERQRFIQAAVHVSLRLLVAVFPDVDDHSDRRVAEPEQQPPPTPQVDDAEVLDARSGEPVARRVTPGAFEGFDRIA